MIESKEISVVIQGPVYGSVDDREENQITIKCIKRVKELLPECELILSTWEGTDIRGIDADIVILNKDPGSIMMVLNGVDRMNNTNRMIVSTINGVKKSTRKYVLKMRSDMYLHNLAILGKFDLYKIIDEESILDARIISLSANHPQRGAKIVFTISDWAEFGYREDVLKFWDVPVQDDLNMVYKNGKCDWDENRVAESYIWPQFLMKDKRYRDFLQHYKGPIPINKDTIALSEKSLAEYVVLYDGNQLGVNSLKYLNKNYVRRDFARASCYMHYEWKGLYKKYCDHNCKINIDLRDRFDVAKYILVFHFLRRILNPVYQCLKKVYIKMSVI